MVRGSTFYFKRRVPTGLEHAFPEARSGQVWKSLDTDLVTKASGNSPTNTVLRS